MKLGVSDLPRTAAWLGSGVSEMGASVGVHGERDVALAGESSEVHG